jgi:hypothetical protein
MPKLSDLLTHFRLLVSTRILGALRAGSTEELSVANEKGLEIFLDVDAATLTQAHLTVRNLVAVQL